eukprot:gene12539-biopygen11601
MLLAAGTAGGARFPESSAGGLRVVCGSSLGRPRAAAAHSRTAGGLFDGSGDAHRHALPEDARGTVFGPVAMPPTRPAQSQSQGHPPGGVPPRRGRVPRVACGAAAGRRALRRGAPRRAAGPRAGVVRWAV